MNTIETIIPEYFGEVGYAGPREHFERCTPLREGGVMLRSPGVFRGETKKGEEVDLEALGGLINEFCQLEQCYQEKYQLPDEYRQLYANHLIQSTPLDDEGKSIYVDEYTLGYFGQSNEEYFFLKFVFVRNDYEKEDRGVLYASIAGSYYPLVGIYRSTFEYTTRTLKMLIQTVREDLNANIK